MVRLYKTIANNKLYYNKDKNSFGNIKNCTHFVSIRVINNILKDQIYDSLMDLRIERVEYIIKVKGFDYIIDRFEFAEGAKLVCDELNKDLNREVFSITENIYDDKRYDVR